jgi:hypothetical protein
VSNSICAERIPPAHRGAQMTPLPRKRCDNERICYLYKNAMVGKKRKGPCNISPCISDTRSRPAPSPEKRTYQSCNMHFSCPDGEECWYWSEDYYWDCGRGAQILMEAEKNAAAQSRQNTIYEMLKDLGFGCPGKPLTPICDLCKANKYCIELRHTGAPK